MSVIKYIGRKTDFRGKTLWEIVGNLKNFGVGRVVVRSAFERYSEPSFLRILKVEAVPDADPRKVRVTVERTFRGVTAPNPVVIFSASYKDDYRLIPKDEEPKYTSHKTKMTEQILPQTIEMPPLLREFLFDETGDSKPMIKVHFKKKLTSHTRLAKEGEKPTVELGMGLGVPASPRLYENCL